MLTKIRIKNFKTLKDTGEIPLDDAVVLVGPNNTGKTSVLQALMLWQLGVSKWMEKRPSDAKRKTTKATKRTGVPINRKDIFAVPVRSNKLLWTDLFTIQLERDTTSKIKTSKDINIEIIAEGITNGQAWACGLEFEYRDEEVIYVRPLRDFPDNAITERQDLLQHVRIAFLPPMSGLKDREEKLLPATIDARIGEGRTAEVLRNICYQVCYPETENQKSNRNPEKDWEYLVDIIKQLFGIELEKPVLDSRGEFELYFSDKNKNRLEISSAGRGLQQTLLLVSFFLIKPNTTLLFDEPNAHLEILKQKQVYNLLKELSAKKGSQIIAATHSEQILNESVHEDIVVAFFPAGNPRLINDKKEILKSLRDYGFEHYYAAAQRRWVLYLEGSTDLDILMAFANKLNHPAKNILGDCYVHYLNGNDPATARNHFSGLKAAFPEFLGIAVYDNISNPLNTMQGLQETAWKRKEIENYFFVKDVFLRYASECNNYDLFESEKANRRLKIMEQVLQDELPGKALRDTADEFWITEKASKWMQKIFASYFEKQNLPVELSKNKYSQLVNYLRPEETDADEIKEKLDLIYHVYEKQNRLQID